MLGPIPLLDHGTTSWRRAPILQRRTPEVQRCKS
jgi:hypothetical protein